MSWTLLPVDYTDAIWSGLKKYTEVTNDDGTVSFQDVTQYSNKEKSFFGALDANRMNEALNTIMSMVESGTDLYEAFQNYFVTQQELFEETADSKQAGFDAYLATLRVQGDAEIQTIKTDYRDEVTIFENTQEQVFTTWFNLIKGQLSEDAAGHLQNEVNGLDERLSSLEYMVLQNDLSAPIVTDDAVITLITDDLDYAILADWKQ